MDNLKRIRIMNILHEMEAEIRNNTNIGKAEALELLLTVDRFWDEIKGDSELEEKWHRAASRWQATPHLESYTTRIHEQLFLHC